MADEEQRPAILAAVDFSDHSASALHYAAELSKRLDDRLIVLHVIHDQAGGYYSDKKLKKGEKKRLKRLEEVAGEMMDEFLQQQIEAHVELKPVLKKAEVMLVSGLTVTKVLQVIEKTSPEMLVLGNKGRSSLKHILLGSKAEQLARLCPVPVTLVKP
ncbi:MAG: universal stress protein [Chromatiales bacterium]|jgi:nucleotide-binding universal stress UspA family protein